MGSIYLAQLKRQVYDSRLKTFARRNSNSSRDESSFGFTSSELRRLHALKTPAGIQKFLDELPYNLSYTARSPKKVLQDRTASCLEGGIFGAAALRIVQRWLADTGLEYPAVAALVAAGMAKAK